MRNSVPRRIASDLAIEDRALNADQKRAIIFGLRRMESVQISRIQTAEQRSEVQTKILERLTAEKQETTSNASLVSVVELTGSEQ